MTQTKVVWFKDITECIHYMRKHEPETLERRLILRELTRLILDKKKNIHKLKLREKYHKKYNRLTEKLKTIIENEVKHLEYECREIEKALAQILTAEKIYTDWLRFIPVFKSPFIASSLIGECIDPRRFRYGSHLVSYTGMSSKGVRAIGLKIGFMPNLKLKTTLAFYAFLPATRILSKYLKEGTKPSDMLLKLYYENYFKVKEKFPNYTKLRTLRRAWRMTMKVFLSCFWKQWLIVTGVPEEEIPPPYPQQYLGHYEIIEPHHFVASRYI